MMLHCVPCGFSLSQGRRPPSFLRQDEYAAAGQWLEEAVGLKPTVLLNRLLDNEISTTPSRLRSYFDGRRLPEPPTLRAICEAGDVSYVEAIDRFGYYREIVKLLDDLVWLGARWMEEDDARGGTVGVGGALLPHLDSLRDLGIVFWKSRPIMLGAQTTWTAEPALDPDDIPSFDARYIVGSWCELEHELVQADFAPMEAAPGETTSLTIPSTFNARSISATHAPIIIPDRYVYACAPKPIGVAILISTLAFPLRGDSYKDDVEAYRLELAKAAGTVAALAWELRSSQRSRGRRKSLHPMLQRVIQSLDDPSIPFNFRRSMAAEYALIWADSLCKQFTHYARLASFEFWGQAGGRSWTTEDIREYVDTGQFRNVRAARPSVFAMMPQIREASLPKISSIVTL
jgi:hypothetical protein